MTAREHSLAVQVFDTEDATPSASVRLILRRRLVLALLNREGIGLRSLLSALAPAGLEYFSGMSAARGFHR
jgi:hypothetical protein